MLAAMLLAIEPGLTAPAAGSAVASPRQTDQPPVFAYYYIWFDHSSWRRAKTDYPLLGRYSSDDTSVMRRHVRWAKDAGIEGFIVSWKSTPTLDRRLAKLIRVARSEHFKLAIIYQGLDFEREPLPATHVAHDLDFFTRRYGRNPVFRIFGKPLVIWSGTWRFAPVEIEKVTAPLRDRLLILSSEKNVAGYERVARFVDGDAYYWSSVNPDTYPGYGRSSTGWARPSTHATVSGIAPAAAGFDARLIGGETVVPRLGGDTFQHEFDAALASSPDAVGVISWNEFSENSHIEPSRHYGDQSLQVLADLNKTNLAPISDFESSAPAGTGTNVSPGSGESAGFLVLTVGGFLVVARRRRRGRG